MTISRKMLALLAAAALGTGLAACQREAEDRSVTGEAPPMDQAPRQGYTGPGSPSASPPGSEPGGAMQGGQSGDSQAGSPGSTNPSANQPRPGMQEEQERQQR